MVIQPVSIKLNNTIFFLSFYNILILDVFALYVLSIIFSDYSNYEMCCTETLGEVNTYRLPPP